MKSENYEKCKVATVIDRGDQIFLYIRNLRLRSLLKGTKDIRQSINEI